MLCNGNNNISSESGNSEHINGTTAGSTISNNQAPNFFIINCGNYLYSYIFHQELTIRKPEGLANGTKLSIWAGYECIAEKYINNDGDPCTINVNATGAIDVIDTCNLSRGAQIMLEEGINAPFIINSFASDGELLNTRFIESDKGTCRVTVDEEGEIYIQELDSLEGDEEMHSSDSDNSDIEETEEDADNSETEEDTDSSDSDEDSDTNFGNEENIPPPSHQNFQPYGAPPDEQSPPSTTSQILEECTATLCGANSPLSSDSEGEY